MTTKEEINQIDELDARYTELEEFVLANNLEEEWLKSLPPEDVPLDDDLPDFLDNNAEDFYNYCLEQYQDFIRAGGDE